MIDKMIDEMKDYQLYAIRNAIMGIDVAKHCIEIAEKYKSQEQRWISVDEALPEEDGLYAVVVKHADIYGANGIKTRKEYTKVDVAEYYNGEFHFYSQYSIKQGIIVWMPLPKYRGETDVNE